MTAQDVPTGRTGEDSLDAERDHTGGGVPVAARPTHVVSKSETTLPRMTLTADTEKALRTAGRKVAEWTAERDRLIKQAVAEGGSLREIGTAAGVSHTAVKFIAHGRPGRSA